MHKYIIFILMFYLEIVIWYKIGEVAAPLFVSKDKQYEYSGSACNCSNALDEVSNIIYSANISDVKKADYMKKLGTMNSFERASFARTIQEAKVNITYEERKGVVAHRIMFLGVFISFMYMLIMLVLLTTSSPNGYYVTVFGWVIVLFIMLIRTLTVGRKERNETRRLQHSKKVSGLAEKFKNFNRVG